MAEDYGLKVSLEGYDVQTCTELQTAFSNNSNLLKVAYTGSGTIPAGNVVTITHDLGYVPQFLVYGDVYNPYEEVTTSYLATGDFWDQLVAGADTTTLKVIGMEDQPYTYYIFYETIDGTSQDITASDADYGVKVMKTGYDITSTNLDHQSLNSEKNCLKIAKSGTYSGTSIDSDYNTVSIAHGLPYTPSFLTWFQINGDGLYYAGTSLDSIEYVSADGTNLYFTYHGISADQSIKCYYILFVEKST